MSDYVQQVEETLEEQYGQFRRIEPTSTLRSFDDGVEAELWRLSRKYGGSLFNQAFQSFNESFFRLQSDLRSRDLTRLEDVVVDDLPKITNELRSVKPHLKQFVSSIRKGGQNELQETQAELDALREQAKALVESIGKKREGQIRIDETVLTFTLPVFAGALGVILLGPWFYSGETQKAIFQSNVVLEMATVFLLTSTILILGISEKITGEVLGTLIGGISGYVLGRWRRREDTQRASDGT